MNVNRTGTRGYHLSYAGFSPFELVYERSIQGLLQATKEQWIEPDPLPKEPSLYIEWLRENLSGAQDLAWRNLSKARDKMKKRFNWKTRIREFQEGDKVLLLSPSRETPLSERFRGLYTVARRVDSMNYEVNTPERRQKTQVYHVNIIKKKCGLSEQTYVSDKKRKWRR